MSNEKKQDPKTAPAVMPSTDLLTQIARDTRKQKAQTIIEEADEHPVCTCCEDPIALVLRPDLSTNEEGHALYAICVIHDPPQVYKRYDINYILVPDLSMNEAGNIVQGDETIAEVASDFYQRLATADDDEFSSPASSPSGGSSSSPSPSRPSQPQMSRHVDLSEDDFYKPRNDILFNGGRKLR